MIQPIYLVIHQGHHVDSVGSGQAALERLAQQPYDLVVCDLHMLDLDGRAVDRAIERRPPPRPAVMFVTGYADAGPYEDFIRTTQAPVVGKPFAPTRSNAVPTGGPPSA